MPVIPFFDLKAQFASIRLEVMEAMERVVESQRFILGEEVELLEEEIAKYCGVKYAVGCASGSDALLLALKACNIVPGDEVLTVPYTFFATAGAIHHAGAVPVFVDVETDTFNMDVAQAAALLKARPRIKAIIPVHLFGGCARMEEICHLASQNGIPVIEDAAQALGAEYKSKRAGSIGDIGCFSFFPTKNLGAFGDAGICTTNREELAKRLRSLRVHGTTRKYYHETVGMNSRLDALQAAVLRVKLRYLDQWTSSRRRHADRYRNLLQNASLRLPFAQPYQTRHIFNQFVVQSERRDRLQSGLLADGVGTEIYYPLPLHLQPCFHHLGYSLGDFPVSERLAETTLALPIFPELLDSDLEHVARSILSAE